jgi:hypothetical protein
MPKVYIVQRPIQNKYGFTPDLTDASRYVPVSLEMRKVKNDEYQSA